MKWLVENADIKSELRRMAPLLLMAAFACVLYLLRRNVLGERAHFSMIWNLFLAWIPYGISCIMLVISNFKKSKLIVFGLLLLGAMWLLFFPNAPYLLTNYAHFSWVGFTYIRPGLAEFVLRPWYDFIMFTTMIWCGVLVGLASLDIVHNMTEKQFGRIVGWIFVVVVNFLSSWAIYLGRFIRLNSWDVFTNPGILLPYLSLCRERVLFICLLSVFMVILYVCYCKSNRRKNLQ